MAVDPKQAARNKSNTKQGKSFEGAIADGCEVYKRLGIAHVGKLPTPFINMGPVPGGKPGDFTGRHSARSHVDFFGVFGPQAPQNLRGLAIALECKSTRGNTLPYSGLREQQVEWLSVTPMAFVAVWFVDHAEVRLVPWKDVAPGQSIRNTDGVRVDAVKWLDPVLAAATAILRTNSLTTEAP